MTLLAESRTPLVSYLASVLRAVRPLPPLDLELNQAYGNVLAEDHHPELRPVGPDHHVRCWLYHTRDGGVRARVGDFSGEPG